MEAQGDARIGRQRKQTRPALFAAGGVLGALTASSCCLLPLALFSVGASGAWLGNLSVLMPYQPAFIVITAGFIVAGFWMVYRRPAADCADGPDCAGPVSGRVVKGALWSASVLVVAAAAFPYVAPLLLDV